MREKTENKEKSTSGKALQVTCPHLIRKDDQQVISSCLRVELSSKFASTFTRVLPSVLSLSNSIFMSEFSSISCCASGESSSPLNFPTPSDAGDCTRVIFSLERCTGSVVPDPLKEKAKKVRKCEKTQARSSSFKEKENLE